MRTFPPEIEFEILLTETPLDDLITGDELLFARVAQKYDPEIHLGELRYQGFIYAGIYPGPNDLFVAKTNTNLRFIKKSVMIGLETGLFSLTPNLKSLISDVLIEAGKNHI